MCEGGQDNVGMLGTMAILIVQLGTHLAYLAISAVASGVVQFAVKCPSVSIWWVSGLP